MSAHLIIRTLWLVCIILEAPRHLKNPKLTQRTGRLDVTSIKGRHLYT